MARILIGNIKGPQGAKGDKGDKGDTGPQGPAGPQGATGPMPALVNGFTTTEAGIAALDAAAGKTLKDEVTQLNSDMMIKSVESTLNIEVNQGGITLYKSGKVVQVFCDIAPKSNVNPLTVISSVPSGYFPNEKGFLGYLINQTTGQCVPIFIDAGGQMRTTEILGLEQGNIYYGAGCYVCQ